MSSVTVEDPTPAVDTSQRIKTALDRFKLGVDARTDQRKRETLALEFQVPEKQWPDEVKTQRQPQVVGGVAIPARPMLAIPSLDQPIQLVLNQERQAHLGVQIHPISEDADDDTAEVLQGLYRRIEVDSRANLARSFGFERGVKAGTGEYEVTTEYDEDGGHFTDQRIVIKRILHQGSVVRDPFAQEPDWSDGMWAFKTTDLAWDTYKQKYPKSALSQYTTSELDTLGTECEGWITGEGPARAVRIAAYYEIRITKRRRVLLDDGSDAFDDQIPAGRRVMAGDHARDRQIETRTLWYSIINAIEELEPASEQNGRYIPLIPCIGRELIPFDNERRWVGIIEPNMDGARLINYSASSAVELAALETKAPYSMYEGQEVGHEQEWQLANVRNFPYLRHKPVMLPGGTVAPPPLRTQVDTGRLGPSMLLLETGKNFVHEGTGAFAPTLGMPSKDRTGKAILALQQQHDQGTSNFLDNLAEVTMTYEAKVVLDLIPHIYDRPGRVARILDKEDNPKTVMLNAPFVLDPQTKRPRPAPQPAMPGSPPPASSGAPSAAGAPGSPQAPPPKVLQYDLKKGRYGVTVAIGKSYKSRVDQGADMLGQIIQADPAILQLAGDIYFKFADFPGHIELSERFKKMLPPPLQDQQDPQAAAQQVGALKGQLEQMQQQMSEMVKALETDKVKVDGQVQIAKIGADKDVLLKTMDNAAKIAVAKIGAAAKGAQVEAEAEDEAIALGQQHAFEANQAELDRQHELEAATVAHQQAQQQAVQGVDGQAALADQAHGQALEAGEVGHDQALQQAEQAAALAPQPEAE